ncbi:MAG: hypothetical protein K8R69_06180 [Deltaproteobacteria bacterium]|nr:hypothetical protein [Deltaproteobacteria bacterium]
MPPSYCLPWVEAARFSIQLKANEEYVVQKGKKSIKAWILQDGKKIPDKKIWLKVPEKSRFLSTDPEEIAEHKMGISKTPAFSSPWQRKQAHSVTLKLGICWYTPPGYGMFFSSAVHKNEQFRVVEGFVRTDQWNKDVPIIIRPLVEEVHIPKYSVVASAFVVPIEDIELASVADDPKKISAVIKQTSLKRLSMDIYKQWFKGQ